MSAGADSSAGSNAFQVQGQVDIPSIGPLSYTAAKALLERAVHRGIEPHTLSAGYAIGARLAVGRLAADNIMSSVRNMKVSRAYHTSLWFGFGIKHIIRRLVESKEGLALVGLIGCLSECYQPETSARILEQLWATAPVSTQLTPSIDQWTRLVGALSGALASSHFGILLGQTTFQAYKSTTNRGKREVPVKELVAALQDLIKLSASSKEGIIQLAGGIDCGWLAAVAHWLMDFAIQMRTTTDDSVVVLGSRGSSKHTLQVTYHDLANPDGLRVAQRCHIIPNGWALLRPRTSMGSSESLILDYGRVMWDAALTSTFGPHVEALLSGPFAAICGKAMGYAFCMFGLYGQQLHLPDSVRLACGGNLGYGLNFVETVKQWLPELTRSESLMLVLTETLYQNTSFKEAVSRFDDAMTMVTLECRCPGCHIVTETGSTALVRSEAAICLPALVLMLSALTAILSRVYLHIVLGPKRAALERLYRQSLSALTSVRTAEVPFHRALEHVMNFDYFNEAVRLFIATSPSTGNEERSDIIALVSQGLCIHAHALCNVTDDPIEISRIYLMPGGIEYDDVLYDMLVDHWPVDNRSSSDKRQMREYNPRAALSDTCSKEIVYTMEVIEQQQPFLGIRYIVDILSLKRRVYICPRSITDMVLLSSFPLPCAGRSRCPGMRMDGIYLLESEGFWSPDRPIASYHQTPTVILPPVGVRLLSKNVLSRWVVLWDAFDPPSPPSPRFSAFRVGSSRRPQQTQSTGKFIPFLQSNQCLCCCVNHLRAWYKSQKEAFDDRAPGCVPLIIARDIDALQGGRGQSLTPFLQAPK